MPEWRKKETSPIGGMPVSLGFIFRRMPKMFDIKFSKRRFWLAEVDIKKKEKKGETSLLIFARHARRQ